jgi:hypothetical protein
MAESARNRFSMEQSANLEPIRLWYEAVFQNEGYSSASELPFGGTPDNLLVSLSRQTLPNQPDTQRIARTAVCVSFEDDWGQGASLSVSAARRCNITEEGIRAECAEVVLESEWKQAAGDDRHCGHEESATVPM